MLSTVHEPRMVRSHNIDRTTGEYITKPAAVLDYNINMRLVDKSDALISSVECARKNMKWYRKLFFHLLDMATHNAHILHRNVTHKNETYEDFVLELVRQLIAKHHPESNRKTRYQNVRGRQHDTPARLVERHFCTTVPPTAGKQYPQRMCKVCMHTSRRPKVSRKLTRHECVKCEVGLCFPQCFIDYHTLDKY